MLQKIRDKSGSWVIKIILSVIGASFVVFGVVDVVRILTALPPVAEVGKAKIDMQEFHHAYQRHLASLRKNRIELTSSEQKKRMVSQVIDALIANKVMSREPERRGILVPKNLVMEYLQSLPYFQKDGHFDAETFQIVMRRLGMTPQQMAADISQDLAMQQLLGPLTMGLHLGETTADQLTDILFQKRRFAILTVKGDTTQQEDPTEEALAHWLKEHKKMYMTPAQRSAEVILLPHKALEDKVKLTEEDLRKAYQERQDEFATPEVREVKRLAFNSESDAIAAKKALATMTSDEQLKKKFPDLELSEVKPHDLPAEDADIIFRLQAKENYGPVLRHQKWTLYAVTKFEPSVTKPFEEVKNDLEADLRKTEVAKNLQALKEQIEDAFASGKTFDEVAKDYPLELKLFPTLTKNDAKEKLANVLSPGVVEIVAPQVFVQEKGEESDFYDVSGYSFIVRVTQVQKKTLPELNDIRDRLVKDWKKDKSRSRIMEKCSQTYGRIESYEEWQKTVQQEKALPKEYQLSRFDSFDKDHEIYKLLEANDVERLLLLKNRSVAFFELKGEADDAQDTQIAIVFPIDSFNDVGSKLDTAKLEQRERIHKLLQTSFDEEAVSLIQRSIIMSVPVKVNKDTVKKVLSSLSEG